MRLLGVFPGVLHYSKIFLRLEPIGLELVAQAARRAGHEVRLIDLQVEDQRAYFQMLESWRPDVVAFSCNYLPHVPEIVDLAKATKTRFPHIFICVGGHSASFTAASIIEHGAGAIDCVLKGEGEAGMPMLLAAIEAGRDAVTVPGAVTADGEGPPPGFVHSLDDLTPARDLLRHRRKYFLGTLDPCATIEFSRGCPWDCSFCSAWTFYGRSYRLISPERAVEDLRSIREPGVFIVDDVAFLREGHAMAIGEAIARSGIKKQYYL
jgi:hopanoid C-3 methylase HpnR